MPLSRVPLRHQPILLTLHHAPAWGHGRIWNIDEQHRTSQVGGLFQEEEFVNNLMTVEAAIKVMSTRMMGQHLEEHGSVVAFCIGSEQAKVIKSGLSKSSLVHVNSAIWLVFNVDSNKVFNALL